MWMKFIALFTNGIRWAITKPITTDLTLEKNLINRNEKRKRVSWLTSERCWVQMEKSHHCLFNVIKNFPKHSVLIHKSQMHWLLLLRQCYSSTKRKKIRLSLAYSCTLNHMKNRLKLKIHQNIKKITIRIVNRSWSSGMHIGWIVNRMLILYKEEKWIVSLLYTTWAYLT